MNVVSRGVRNAFRNQIRTFSIVVILGLSMGLALAMLIAYQAVTNKINSVKSSVGNTVSISPAGVRGFEGGGNPLTDSQLSTVKKLPHIVSVSETLNDRLTSSDTNLVSAIDAGSLGRRNANNSGQSFTPSGGDRFGGGSGGNVSFTPPVTLTGTITPTQFTDTTGGGTFKLTSGKLFADNSNAMEAIVGKNLATKNNLAVGGTFTAYGKTVVVTGIFDGGNTFVNNQVVMPLTTVQTLSSQPDAITAAVATVDSLTNIDSATTAIQKSLGASADVTNSAEQAKQVVSPLQNIQNISLYSLIGAITAGAVIILLTMVMIVRERRREIGVLKAIGASNLTVNFQFMIEAVSLTLMASIIGILLGVLAGNPITRLLVNNASSNTGPGGGGGFRMAGRGLFGGFRNNISNIHGVVGWSILGYGLLVAILIAVIGSSLASLAISKVRPAEVMRTE